MPRKPTANRPGTPPRYHLEGQKFGRWLVLERSHANSHYSYFWSCVCDCGTRRNVLQKSLLSGLSRSCGCLKREVASETSKKHGLSNTKEYKIWAGIKDRCHNPDTPSYKNYGARNIRVCQRWLDSFEDFMEDMGERPSPLHTVDRINNNEGYFPSNCRWATRKQQQRNSRQNRLLTYMGKTLCVAEWSEVIGIEDKVLRSRIERGWSVEKALTTPVNLNLSSKSRNANLHKQSQSGETSDRRESMG